MRRISKTFVSLFALGVAAAVTLTASPAFAQAMDPARADRDKLARSRRRLAVGLSALGGASVRDAPPASAASRASRATRRPRARSSSR